MLRGIYVKKGYFQDKKWKRLYLQIWDISIPFNKWIHHIMTNYHQLNLDVFSQYWTNLFFLHSIISVHMSFPFTKSIHFNKIDL